LHAPSNEPRGLVLFMLIIIPLQGE